jgi:hypothetical protein
MRWTLGDLINRTKILLTTEFIALALTITYTILKIIYSKQGSQASHVASVFLIILLVLIIITSILNFILGILVGGHGLNAVEKYKASNLDFSWSSCPNFNYYRFIYVNRCYFIWNYTKT